jgi:Lon protease-like protein
MVLLRPGWEHDYEGRPPVYSVGCSGVITHFERLGDGRYNIILRGVERFRIVGEDHVRLYRRARVDGLPEREPGPEDRAVVRAQRAKLEALLAPALQPQPTESRPGRAAVGAVDLRGAAAMPDADLVNALAQYLDLEPLEKQALLEQSCLRSRALALVELLEMKLMMAHTPGLSNTAH